MSTAHESTLTANYQLPSFRERLANEFARADYVKLPRLLAADAWRGVLEAAGAISGSALDRDFLMPGYDTPRKMRVIGGKIIAARSPELVALYRNDELQELVAAVTGAPIFPCRHPTEFMVMNTLDREGSTHGWHFDDPAIALVIVLRAPPAEFGGMLQYVDSHHAPEQRQRIRMAGGLSKYLARPTVRTAIHAQHHEAGDAFLLRADRCLHRVTPLSSCATRIVLNLAYENDVQTQYGDTASILYDEPISQAA